MTDTSPDPRGGDEPAAEPAEQTTPTTPTTLSYRSADADRRTTTSVPQVFVGAVLTVILVVGGLFFAILLSFTQNSVWPLVVLGALALGLLGLALTSLHPAYRAKRRRGFAHGVFIGLGIALLIEGICWMAMTK